VRQLNWPRIFAEGVAIVVSILLAFGIQAWWDGVQEREEEQALLAGLLAEFETNVEQLDLRISEHNMLSSTGRDLQQRLLVAGRNEVTVPDSLLFSLFVNTSYDATLGTLGEAQSAGRLGLIRNQPLRGTLSAWQGLLEDAQEEAEIAARLHTQNFLALFGDAVPIAHLSNNTDRSNRTLGRAWMDGDSPPELHDAYTTIRASPALASYTAERTGALGRSARELTRLRETLGTIIQMLQSEITQ